MSNKIGIRMAALVVAAALACSAGRVMAAEFVADPAKSSIEVDVKATGHKFSGKLSKYSLAISGDAASLTPRKVALGWDFADLLTGDGKRDEEMLEWLEHPKFMKGSFTLSSFTKKKDGTQWAEGTLKFHGVDKKIGFPVKTVRKGDAVTVSGNVPVDYRDFDLDKIRMALVLVVNPVVNVRFELTGKVR